MSSNIFEKLQHLVFDESKIVTYKTLCQLLKVNVNEAKRHLEEFFNSNREKLGAYYVVIGLQQNGNKQQVTKVVIVPAAELEKTRNNFVSVASCHIYCIHKGELVDKLALFTDCETKVGNEFSSIKNPHIQIQPQRTIEKVVKPVVAKEENKAEQKNKTERPEISNANNKGTDIFSMFQKKQVEKKASEEKPALKTDSNTKEQEQKSNENKPTTKNTSNASDVKKTNEKGKNHAPESKRKDEKSITHLFSKQIEKNANSITKANKESKPPSPETKRKSVSSQSSSGKYKDRRASKKQKKQSESDSDENMKPKKKKHRRIMAMNDSDSESENEELADKAQRELLESEPVVDTPPAEDNFDEEEDCIPPTPVPTGKKKKLKLVTKTFMDEDGYFVTKRVKEYVTASEESETEEKEKSKPPTPKEVNSKASFGNKKQVSLTSFFKQK